MQAQKHAQTKLDTSSNIGRDKSFVDDLNKELGIVRMRVAFVPRSAEISPCSSDLFKQIFPPPVSRVRGSSSGPWALNGAFQKASSPNPNL